MIESARPIEREKEGGGTEWVCPKGTNNCGGSNHEFWTCAKIGNECPINDIIISSEEITGYENIPMFDEGTPPMYLSYSKTTNDKWPIVQFTIETGDQVCIDQY